MSVSAGTVAPSTAAPSTIFVGLDVHKESITLAILSADAPAPVRVDTLPSDLKKLRRYLETVGPAATLRMCYEASGAGYVLQRQLATWGDRLHGDRALADPDQAGRAAEARHIRRRAARATLSGGGTHRRAYVQVHPMSRSP